MKNLIQTTLCMAAILMPFSLSAQDSDGIEDVIVTATKRVANVQAIPMVVDVFSETEINDLNINTIQDIGNLVPSLIVT